jgi:putative toxin-antitoxin system antitoxin component (TIGR02293 family)
MATYSVRDEPVHPFGRAPVGPRFSALKSAIDARVLQLFASKAVQRILRNPARTQLEPLWLETALAMSRTAAPKGKTTTRTGRRISRPSDGSDDALEVHRLLVAGLPGEALYISSAMAFDKLQDALPLFGLSAKTARARIGDRLSPGESEIALRIGRVFTMAADLFGSPDMARSYLRTTNFALGGAAPRDLLKTAEGEQLVLSELQAHADGGPV